ncbi:hypothetical protein A4X09_0g5634 [Tilletia walkeri]|uniref:Phosphoglycerate mutase family protein n=1 Tax=Tilletia walkeri TaxID=117179 RepID=A0A8X7N6T8_9BASI|nr:hypothetical protein A4X09_0g5634 [Tilletia walkeri]
MLFRALLASLLAASAAHAAVNNQIYLIRHGEKVSDSSVGLSSQGQQRAQCLRNVFGRSSGYNIGKIFAQAYNSDGSRNRPYQTVLPLSQDLGLKVDTSCVNCVHDAIHAFASQSSAAILVCWEHDALEKIGSSIGQGFSYPSSHFDLIYRENNGALTSNSPYSERCPGLDV